MVFGEFAGVVPDVHLWVVEDVFEWAEWDADVGVVEVTDDDGEDVDDDEVFDAKADEG